MNEQQLIEQGDRLKKIRKYFKVNQQELAKILKTKQSFISNIENGKKGLSRNLLTKISNVYPEINQNWLLTGEGEMIQENNSANIVQSTPNHVHPSNDFVHPIEHSEANDRQEPYSDKDEEIAYLRRRIRRLEQFISQKFPDFDPGDLAK